MIWKIKAVEARETDDENEYEFTAPILGSDGHEIQILSFDPPYPEDIEIGDDGKVVPTKMSPPVVIYAYPDRSE